MMSVYVLVMRRNIMTKEQIIIDGVDVSECEFYNPYYCGMYIDGYGDSEGVCSDYEDCYYKQLARKTQECEELKEKIKQIRNFRDKVISQLKEKNEKLKAESFTSDELISIQEKDIDRYRKALEAFQDDYFKGLDTTTIAELAKKSIRLTTENRKLEQECEELKEKQKIIGKAIYKESIELCNENARYLKALEEIEGVLLSYHNDLYIPKNPVADEIERLILDIISKAKVIPT